MIAELPNNLTDEQKKAIAQNNLDIEKALGMAKGPRMKTEDADEQKANPNYIHKFIPDNNGKYVDPQGNRYNLNPKYNEKSNRPYMVNCATCTPAYILRQRGFDITAKGRVEGSGSLNDSVAHNRSFEMWKNADGTPAQPVLTRDWMTSKGYRQMTKGRYEEYFNEVCKEEGVYVITIGWKGGGGHATVLQRESDGKLYYIEPQEYNKYLGTRRNISELSVKGAKDPYFKRGILRVDDKVFDTAFLPLFNR